MKAARVRLAVVDGESLPFQKEEPIMAGVVVGVDGSADAQVALECAGAEADLRKSH